MTPLPRLPRSFQYLCLALLAVFLLAATGCVSQGEYKALQTAHEQALAQLADSENNLKLARAKNAELEAKIAELDRLLDQSGGLGALKRERDLLAQQLADLQKKYNDLLNATASAPTLSEDTKSLLRDLAAKYPDLLEFDERLGMIRLKSDLTFDLGSTEVKPRAKEALGKLAAILNLDEIKNNEITVMGHTDDVPIRQSTTMKMNPTNEILSTNRAWAVADVLHANGVADARLNGAGWGEERPIAPNAPGKRGNEKNRRVDIYIRPTKVPEGITVSTPGAARSTAPTTPHRTTTPHAPATPPATSRPAVELAPAIPG